MTRVIGPATSSLLVLTLIGCGSDATVAGTSILVANVEEDLPREQRSGLVGVLTADPVPISFPDGEGTVEVIVTSARASRRTGDRIEVDMESPPNMLRSIEVRVSDSAGYAISAELIGMPTNTGSADRPEHTRTLRVTRRKTGLTGTSLGQMSIRVRPSGAERL